MVILLGSNIVSASSVFTVEEGEMWVDCNDCIIEISKDDTFDRAPPFLPLALTTMVVGK